MITIKTSADESYVQPIDDEGVVVYSGDEAKIVAKLTEDKELRLYIENTFDQTIHVSADFVSVNGVTEDYAESRECVLEGKKAYLFIAYPRNAVEKGEQYEFEIKFAIFDDLSDNLALAEPIKDLGTVKVVLSANK